MRWLELRVEAGNEAVEAVSEILARLGRGVAVQPTRLITEPGDELAARDDPTAPYVVTAHVPDRPGAADDVASTERALWHLQAFGLGPVGELGVRSVDDQAWAEAWRSTYAPQRIGPLVVVPSWLDPPLDGSEVAIRMDPGMAFGTGLHPSTRGCLELICRLEPMADRVLDVGSGSGILAIAAVRLGASTATCLDIDPVAVEATRDNARRNGIGDRVTVAQGTVASAPSDRYGLVCANLVARVLVELAERLAAHVTPRGTLIAGGVIAEREGDVATALTAHGLDVTDRIESGEWVSLRLDRAR